jgi:Na+/citrate or Na+/malate symporter
LKGELVLSKEQLIGIYLLWVLVLFIEIGWLYSEINNLDNTSDVSFVITVIAITISIGAVGIYLFNKLRN